MLVHCSHCEETAFVSASGLQAVVSDTGELDGLNLPDDKFPYAFHEVAKCIRDTLINWQVDIEEDDGGVETLKLTCPLHLQQQNIEKLLAQNTSPDFKSEIIETELATSELIRFLISVEAHLKTLVQEHDRPYSYELSQQAAKILKRLL